LEPLGKIPVTETVVFRQSVYHQDVSQKQNGRGSHIRDTCADYFCDCRGIFPSDRIVFQQSLRF
jgi:hypothetical protein